MTVSLSDNLRALSHIYSAESTFRTRELCGVDGCRAAICYFDGMIDSRMLLESAIAPLQRAALHGQSAGDLCARVLSVPDTKTAASLDEACPQLALGHALLLVDGLAELLLLDVKQWQVRGISEPDSERVLQGPREGFTEVLLTNLSLIRRRLQSPDLKVESARMGDRVQSTVCLCYLEGSVDHAVLKELRERLRRVEQAAVLDSNYVTEQIRDGGRSPFQTVGATERPDIIAAKLLEGRVAILCEGSPSVLTVPHLFLELFQSNEDYYVNSHYASFQRLLRMLGFFASVFLPSLYIAMSCFQPELLPTPLAITISASRQSVPFSTVVEALILLFSFDILRESGARSPSNVGQALSVVSSVVLGQAAIQAGFIGSPILIVVAFAGVTSVLVPNLISVALLYRYGILIYTSIFGYWGCIAGLFHMMLHLSGLESFGVPYLEYSYAASQTVTGDTFLREPWTRLQTMPIFGKRRNGEEGGA